MAVFLMLMIELSRVFWGTHFSLDMFAGWLVSCCNFYEIEIILALAMGGKMI